MNMVEMRGHVQHVCGQKRGNLRPLQRRGAVSPSNVLAKKKVACSAWAAGTLPFQRVMIELEADWGTRERFRVRVLLIRVGFV